MKPAIFLHVGRSEQKINASRT